MVDKSHGMPFMKKRPLGGPRARDWAKPNGLVPTTEKGTDATSVWGSHDAVTGRHAPGVESPSPRSETPVHIVISGALATVDAAAHETRNPYGNTHSRHGTMGSTSFVPALGTMASAILHARPDGHCSRLPVSPSISECHVSNAGPSNLMNARSATPGFRNAHVNSNTAAASPPWLTEKRKRSIEVVSEED